ncbi:hypothetical protein M0C40_00440 [Spiroplasma citri]|uniref:Uncharacterized protein n=1 Tax=Spiroplasma citri TaxID=2133 RepID=A0AAX3SZ07_SPICI|nr:hypothetical protein [Spiroplasma citri]WFG96520.1 hypothetical protein M0C40_00440 [Spiroplasma citri]
MGKLLQADASEHLWLGINHPKMFLHGAIYDATNTVVGLYFDYQESFNVYLQNAKWSAKNLY